MAKAMAGPQVATLREFPGYPSIGALPGLIDPDCDLVMVDVDADLERALDLIEDISGFKPSLILMAYSSKSDSELVVRCMRAGAREFLIEPFLPGVVAEALVRAAARHQEVRRPKRLPGRLMVFIGAKGGAGVTTLASNFAVVLAREAAGKVVLVDLDLQLGDAALALGITSRFSVLDALRNPGRLDSEFLSTLVTQHSSGLTVLAAPDEYTSIDLAGHGADRLVHILREEFAYVVIDAGSNIGALHEPLLEMADSIYLVTQVGIPALRNAQRLISRFSSSSGERNLELVLNRFDSRTVEIDEKSIAKALSQGVKWKIPNDYVNVRHAENTGTALAMADTRVSRAICEMARAVSGTSDKPEKKKKRGLFR